MYGKFEVMGTLTLWGRTFLVFSLSIAVDNIFKSRSQWLRGLMRGSAVAGLLGLQVRIPSETWMSVFCGNCLLSDKGLCDEPITSPRGVLTNVMCLNVIAKLCSKEALTHHGLSHSEKNIFIYLFKTLINTM